MELREYMITSGVRTKFFAENLGISTGFLNGVASHRYRPSWNLAKSIEKFTKGKVTAIQLMELTYKNDKE
jgi:DNA-binding transcriptional regulator YdaS (Cro superfamily)